MTGRASPAGVIACVALFFSLAGTAAGKPNAGRTMTVTANRSAEWTTTYPWWRPSTACFYVGRDPLLLASLSDHGLTVTYYGDGTVARAHQLGPHSNVVRVTVSTINPRERVTFKLLPSSDTNC